MVADDKIFFVYYIISKGSGHQPDPFFYGDSNKKQNPHLVKDVGHIKD